VFKDILNSKECYEALQAGDDEAYARLMYYGWRILLPIYRKKGLWHVAEDSFSITVQKLWRTNCIRYKPAKGPFVSWFVTVAIRDALNELRREQYVRKIVEAVRNKMSSPASNEEKEKSGVRPFALIAGRAYKSLADDDQLVLDQRFIRELPFDVIAENLGVQETAARMRVTRAAVRFAEAVERLADFETPKRINRSRRRDTGRTIRTPPKRQQEPSPV